ncbi:Ras and Rab interactor 2-like [Oopsacas minuta]|uniref:Ras and Rab interactor 2-like n=1 Tax=Oopsacas minuta TaxID=111878 RepID=A0AAV7KAH8_9METZ|nr:Ras and Rab interactor 2-like [Oopsacas minuta]
MESDDDDDIYEVLDNDLAHIENEEEIKRYLTVHPNLWMKARAKREEATEMLFNNQAGQFIVRESSQDNTFALSIRVPDNLSKPVNHYLLLKSDLGFEAQGSNLYFPTLPSLLAHFCSYQSGGMPCLLRPPKKKADNCSPIQGYFPPPGPGEGENNEILCPPRGRGIVHTPVLRQTHSVPVQTNMNPKTPRILPPPPATSLRPVTASKALVNMPAQPSHSPSICHPAHPVHLSHPNLNVLPSNDLKHRPYMDPYHQRSITPELDEGPIDYASVEYDTPPDSNVREPIPMVPPRTYLNQAEMEYSGHIVSPDMNEYDEPGEILRNSIPIHRVRTTEESHSSHSHGFLPPPIPPKTASMLIETKRRGATPPLPDDEDAFDSSQEVNSGILYNCIRPKETPPLSKFVPISQSNRDSDVYLDMDPRETSSEMEKDIELQVHHTLKHQNGSNEESPAAYVNVMFNTIATMKRIKPLEEPFEVGFQSAQGKLYREKFNSPVSHFNSSSHDPNNKDYHYNRFTPVNKLSGLPSMPPIAPLSPLRLKHDPVISRKFAFGERMAKRPLYDDIFNKPLPSPRNSIDHDILNNLRRSNSADLLETPNRNLDKPALLPKPKLFIGEKLPQHRRSSSSHECYNVNRNAQTDLPSKESLSRKRSAPSPIDRTLPKPILRGSQHSPEQFSGREREARKVVFSGSTEVRELTRQSREQRLGRSRSPVAPNRPPPPPPPSRRHSVNVNQTNFADLPRGMNVLSNVRNTPWHPSPNNNITSSQGITSSAYMQPLANGKANQWPRHVQTLNRSQFPKDDACKMTRFNQESGDKIIRALKDSQNFKSDPMNGHYDNNNILTQGRNGKLHSKPQSCKGNTDTTDNGEVPKNDDDFGTENLHRDKLRSWLFDIRPI